MNACKAFPNGGFYVMRHKDLYMIVDCVPNNPKGPSSHRHNSRLSFELFAYDKTFIVDPGTYIYTADAKWRNKFRSTAYHNTVVVDGEEQNDFDPYNLFQLGMDAEVKVREWKVTGEYDFLDVQHSGYERLAEPITHRRQIWFNKKEGYWVIKDTLSNNSKSDVFALKSNIGHRFDLYFHFAPMKLIVDEESPLAVRTNFADGANITIMPMETEGLKISVEDGWISYSYGTKVEAPVVKYSKGANVPVDFVTALYPYEGLQPLFSLKERKEHALGLENEKTLNSRIP